jgi:filamentous hemagglutinin
MRGTVNNIGTGRIYGDTISIAAGTLNNDAETLNGVTKAGTIAARYTLDIGAGTINNREHALLFSAGDMFIGGALDANRQATGQGGTLNNLSATVESLGDMSIAMGRSTISTTTSPWCEPVRAPSSTSRPSPLWAASNSRPTSSCWTAVAGSEPPS